MPTRGSPGLSKVYTMLPPSMGRCLMPLIVSGAGMPVASRIVGTMVTKAHMVTMVTKAHMVLYVFYPLLGFSSDYDITAVEGM